VSDGAAAPPLAPRHAAPVLRGRTDDARLTEQLLRPVFHRDPVWWLPFGLFAIGVALLGVAIAYTVTVGIGVWGNNIPVAWAFAIVNFVWWIGIGHAGTFISAFLLLLQQHWRASINRIAEVMTLFAVINAGLFPLLHLGRPWFFYWLAPYPATMRVWPQFRSALPWDMAAVFTYFTVSLLFWYVGLLPDFAAARDRAPTMRRRRAYGVFALGWKGAGRDWAHYRVAYGLLAGLATPLVVSVHSVVSMDFAIAQLPGWHSTIFPPYFVVGAIYSGFAVVLMLLIPIRWWYGLENVVTERHLDAIAKILLATGWLMVYSYAIEAFIAWYGDSDFERYTMLIGLPFGPYGALYWTMIVCNCVTPQLFWFRRMRRSKLALFGGSVLIVSGMWLERFIIIIGSLSRDFLPSSWAVYAPTWVDLSILFGTICLFGLLFLLFLRFVPPIPLSEMKELRHELAKENAEVG
jgi:molybdopterin-containing oxidoreductase family membrane subunit